MKKNKQLMNKQNIIVININTPVPLFYLAGNDNMQV